MKAIQDQSDKVVAYTETKQEAINTVNEMLMEQNYEALTDGEVKDWGIQGGETVNQLQEWVNDYASEMQSERAAWHSRFFDPSQDDIAQE